MPNQNRTGGVLFKVILTIAGFLAALMLQDIRNRQEKLETAVVSMQIQLVHINDKLGIAVGQAEKPERLANK